MPWKAVLPAALCLATSGCGSGLGAEQYEQAAIARMKGPGKSAVSRCLAERAIATPNVSLFHIESGPKPPAGFRPLPSAEWEANSEESTILSWKRGQSVEVVVYPSVASAVDAYGQLQALPAAQQRGRFSQHGAVIVKTSAHALPASVTAMLGVCER
jgi:hypothetical protein